MLSDVEQGRLFSILKWIFMHYFRLPGECRKTSVLLLCFNIWHRTSNLPYNGRTSPGQKYISDWIIIIVIIIIIMVITRTPLSRCSTVPCVQHTCTMDKNKINKKMDSRPNTKNSLRHFTPFFHPLIFIGEGQWEEQNLVSIFYH